MWSSRSATAAWRKARTGASPTATTCACAKAVPGIDVVIGGHSHTELHEAIIVNGRTPWSRPASKARTSANW